ncbi:MAG: hypothetical protein PF795_13195, partial [Kiritimatiellae bacterium]|nr:hypothetical protein [Kiritimatiellia bacterium]
KSALAEFQYPDFDISIFADEAVLTICLLTGLDVLSSQGPCTLNTQQEAAHLRMRIQQPSSIKEVDASLLTRINQRLHPMRAKVTAEENGLIYTLKTAHLPAASE